MMVYGNKEVKNAVITNASISISRGFILDANLTLDYGGSGQGFGGYALYLSPSATHHEMKSVAGHFIYRVMKIAGVESWDKLVGKTIRVRAEHNKVHEIGHIIKDDWFNPSKEFEAMEDNDG